MIAMNKLKEEYWDIVGDILNDEHFVILQNDFHHGTTKYNHLIKVSKLSFVISKVLKLKIEETTKAALLHDFFYGERTLKEENSYLKHPHTAALNARYYFNTNDLETSIIETHMYHHVLLKKIFPFVNKTESINVTQGKPKTKEAWVVSISDLLVSILESTLFLKYKFNIAFISLISIIINK